MEVKLHRRTDTGNLYFIRDNDGRVIGSVDWKMSGDNVGIYCYSHDSRYKPAKIQKIFRHAERS